MENTVMVKLEVPTDVLVAARIRQRDAATELTKELAVHLFEKGILSFGKACELTRMPKWKFMSLLANRKVPLHYTLEDFEDDMIILENLRKDRR